MQIAPCPKRPLRSLTVLLLPILVSPCSAERLLAFGARERVEAGVHIGEVTAGSQPIIRIRSKQGSVLASAEKAAAALREAAVATLSRPAVSVAAGPGGLVAVKAGATTIVTADKGTADLTATTPAALAASWQKTIEDAFREPYLAVSTTEAVLVPVGEPRYVRYGGPLGKSLAVSVDAQDIATAAIEAARRRIRFHGVAPGMTLAALRAGSRQFLLDVEVKYWAAVIAATAVAELTGSGHDEQLAEKVAVNAALAAARPRPGARLSVASATRQESAFRVGVMASGEGYIEAKQVVSVKLQWSRPPAAEPVDLMVSNSPERIHSPGCVMREQLEPDRPARVLYHHVNSTGQRILFTVKVANPGGEPAAAHVLLAESGPGPDELGVGHAAAKRFWERRRTGSGYVLQVPPASASDLVRVAVPNQGIVSGLAQIVPISSSPLYVEVCAERLNGAAPSMWVEPVSPEAYASPKLTHFVFGARKRDELAHEIGGKWTFFNLGGDGSLSPNGTHLAGDYGVLHEIEIDITNPTDGFGQVEVAVRASAGVMRGTFLIDGTLHETGVLRGSQQDILLKRQIPPRGRHRVRIETMPESASNYPIHLVVRSVATD